MAAVDLLKGAGPVAERVMVVARAEQSPDDAKLAASFEARGAEVRLVVDTGFAKMMRDDPYEGIVPEETVETIVSWLAERGGAATSPGETASRVSVVEVAASSSAGAVPALRETFVTFGPDERLYGVFTEPTGAPPAGRPAVCFFNVGANHHVGPHRMNVNLARELAALGYVTMRFDASGLGDSPPAPGGRENRIYTKEAVGDAIAAMDLLRERCGSSRFVLVGLCSGAFVAYHTAVVDTRVVGQVLLSPYAFEWKEGDPVTPTAREDFRTFKSTRFYLQALLDPAVWRRMARGEVNLRAVGEILVERTKTRIDATMPALTARLLRQRRPQTEVESAFRAMCSRGVESLLVLGFSDGGLDMVARYLGNDARRMRGYRNFSMLVLDDADHTFTSLEAQDKLQSILAEYMRTRFG